MVFHLKFYSRSTYTTIYNFENFENRIGYIREYWLERKVEESTYYFLHQSDVKIRNFFDSYFAEI